MQNMMQIIQFEPNDRKLQLLKVPRPRISTPHDVVIKIFFAGICNLDIKVIDGILPDLVENEVTLGHEISGMVAEVGTKVNTFKRGDKVTIDPISALYSSCDKCTHCYKGQPHFCEKGGLNNMIGYTQNGGWAEYTIVPEKQVFKIPENVTLEQALLATPLSCITHAWDMLSPITIDQRILILGAGLVGILWSALLHLEGHTNIIISEPNLCRQDVHRKLDTGFKCLTPDQLQEMQLSDAGLGFDLVIDTCNSSKAAEYGLSLLNKGGTFCIYGIANPEEKFQISPYEMYSKELKIISCNMNPFSFPKALAYLQRLGDRYITFENLGIKTFPLENYKEAIKDIKKGFVLKGVFKMEISCICRK